MDDWYGKTERLLYDHKYISTRVSGLKRDKDLKLSTMFPRITPLLSGDPVQSGKTSDTTSAYAIRRIEGKEITQIEQDIIAAEKQRDVVDGVLEAADEEMRQLYGMRYLNPNRGGMRLIADRLGISRETANKVKDRLVKAVAECMGYLDLEVGA